MKRAILGVIWDNNVCRTCYMLASARGMSPRTFGGWTGSAGTDPASPATAMGHHLA